MRNKKTAILVTSFMLLFALAPMAMATGVITAGPSNMNGISTLINRIANWFQGIVFAIAVVMIIYAGLAWMTAGGEEEKLKKARNALVYALIGIVIALFAGLAKGLIVDMLGGSGSASSAGSGSSAGYHPR